MSCERIDPRDFHSPAANQYTMNSLEELARSPKFNSYVRHIEYKERLYLAWFLAPFTLFGVLYYHLALYGEDGVQLFMDPSARVPATSPTGMAVATVLLLLFAIPYTVIAPFVGFFEEPRRWHSLVTLAFLTAVNVAIVAVGGSRLHYPPFVTTMPPVAELVPSWRPVDIAVVLVRDLFVRRALCLQGFLLAGYAVSWWRRSFWGRAWHPPLPLLTIPVAVGLAGISWWVLTQKSVPLFLKPDGCLTPVSKALRRSAKNGDVADVIDLCVTVGKEIGLLVYRDMASLWQSSQLPAVLQDPSSCVSLYLATASMALTHVLLLLGKPIVDFVVSAALFSLPTDPTLWGLSMVAAVGGAVALWRVDEAAAYTPYIAALGALATALLFNGFVA
ncbi:hypothetical protein NESM_000476400 [Novymonas esmeraldas]|uniref:Uncharacterized protein n=1 Tax=Novymonas esmeraldas TaxID=1808958 RepID=A0AAW0EN70_9TRYP